MKKLPWKHRIALVGAGAATIVASGVAGAAPAQAANHCVNYSYGYGGHAKCIGYIQKLLNFEKIGAKSKYHKPAASYSKLAVDNSYGAKTRANVKGFQRYWGLKADGIVGPKSWHILCYPQMGPGIPKSFPLAAARAAGCKI